MSSPTDIELAIFRTICWFGVFEMPVTRFEIWKWLLIPIRPYDLFEVDQVLNTSQWLSHRISHSQGFYALKMISLPPQIQDRHRRFLDAVCKFRKLRRAALFFRLLPAVEAVAAANTLAWWHTTAQSDIDLYITTKPNRLWSSRFFLVLPFLLTGHRPHGLSRPPLRDPFCFSFFSTTQALQLEALKWSPQDYYLAFWIKSLVPIFDRADVLAHLGALNKWANVMFPNARMRRVHPLHHPRKTICVPIQWAVFEPLFRWMQRRRFPNVLRELANKDSRVVISDDLLKFHENDRRQSFLQRYQDLVDLTL